MTDMAKAIVYDIETLKNCFTFSFVELFGDQEVTFEISQYRDDRVALLAWFEFWRQNQTPMLGYNNLAFDYPVIHFIFSNPDCTVSDIYDCAQERIHDHSNFGTVWPSDRFAPQIDLYKVWHFENPNKRTSLKALQFAMRSESVMEMPIPFDQPLSSDQVLDVLIPYNLHDIRETKKFALISLDAIKFRIEITDDLVKGDVVNWNDVKIGAKLVEQRLGDKLCYSWETGRKQPRQTIRSEMRINDIIFPHVEFKNAEFNRVLSWMRGQTLHADIVTEKLKTKGVFSDVKAHVGGIDFVFGLGGMHASVEKQVFAADSEYAIVDIDVAGMYPANMIANRLYPEHLGEKFVDVFSEIPIERAKYKKGTPRNRGFKLAGNGTFGNTNNVHSVFLDPQVTMATTINGQLLICMLAEWLLTVDSLQLIQANTDGITYRVHRSRLEHAKIIRNIWERHTRLTLEEVHYSRMWIKNVNNYIAEPINGKLKQKGLLWYPRNFPDDITNENAWHKDLGGQVAIMAAVAHMVDGVDIERYIYAHRDPFDFMLRAKCDRSSELWIGDQKQQRILRYYIAHNGAPLRKVSPPTGEPGTYKRKTGKTGPTDAEWLRRPADGSWSEAHHTKNKSRYETRTTAIDAGYAVAECNVASKFDFANLNYQFYIDAAKKLVIT